MKTIKTDILSALDKLKKQLEVIELKNQKRKENAEKRKNRVSIPKKETTKKEGEKPEINTLDRVLLEKHCIALVHGTNHLIKILNHFLSNDAIKQKFREFTENIGEKFNKIAEKITYNISCVFKILKNWGVKSACSG